MPQAYVQFSVRLTQEEAEALDRAAAATGETRNATIRRVLVEWARANQPAGSGVKGKGAK